MSVVNCIVNSFLCDCVCSVNGVAMYDTISYQVLLALMRDVSDARCISCKAERPVLLPYACCVTVS